MMRNSEGMGVVEQIHLGFGFHEDERELVVTALGALDRHLERWRAQSIDLHLSVKDRGHSGQCVTLEARLPRRPSLIVHVSDLNIERALVEARRLMVREIDELHGAMASKPRSTLRNGS